MDLSHARAVVGEKAPRLRLRDARGRTLPLDARDGEPVVVAFMGAVSELHAREEPRIARIRGELRGLGAALLIVTPSGVWRFRPDDEATLCAAGDAMDRASLDELRDRFGAAEGALSLFVIDDGGVLRFARTATLSGEDALGALALALASAGRSLATRARWPLRMSRRELVMTSLLASFAVILAEACRSKPPPPTTTPPPSAGPAATSYDVTVTLVVNGEGRVLTIDPRVSLLDALRERIGLTGTKKGCDHGQCGACTVLVDGRRVNACLTLAIMVQGAKITTIEGLASGDALHPMQAAFVAADGFQCGYCTPGQIMSAVGLLSEGHAHTDDEVREEMSGNVCRCGAYENIVSAVQLARKQVHS